MMTLYEVKTYSGLTRTASGRDILINSEPHRHPSF